MADSTIPVFGSLHRAARDDHAYQRDRARLMLAFQAQLARAYHERNQTLEVRGREVWEAKLDIERRLAQQRAWSEELKNGKEWLESQYEAYKRDYEQLEARHALLNARFDNASHALEQWKRRPLFRVLRRLGLLRDVIWE